jgi:hypothetical protein
LGTLRWKMEVSMFPPIESSEPRRTRQEYREAGCHRLVFTLWPDLLTEQQIEEMARKYLDEVSRGESGIET